MAKLKPANLAGIVLVAVVLGGLGYWLGTLAGGSPEDVGVAAVYEQPILVKDFTLTDQTGTPYTLSGSRGKVVILTFLFTHCSTVCPYSALKMKLALEQLGSAGEKVELVAISTDPERDTVEVLADFSRSLGLYDRWHMVTGPLASMQQLYRDLMITVIRIDEDELKKTAANTETRVAPPAPNPADAPLVGLSETQIEAASDVARKYSGGYQVAHSTPFWILDKDGKLRQSLDVSASPQQIAAAVRTYLK